MLALAAYAAFCCYADPPSVDYAALLSSKFFNGNGGIQIEKIFIKNGAKDGTFKVVVKSNEKTYGEFPMVYYRNPFVNIAKDGGGDWVEIHPAQGGNGVAIIGEPANVSVEIHQNGNPIHTLRFKTSTSTWSGSTLHHFDGPWSQYVAFSKNTHSNKLNLRAWGSLSEAKSTKQVKFYGEIKVDNKPIAHTNQYVLSNYGWVGFDFELVKEDNRTTFTQADLEKQSGKIEVSLFMDGKLARTHTASIKSGVISPMAEASNQDPVLRVSTQSIRLPGNNDGDQILYLRDLSWITRSN